MLKRIKDYFWYNDGKCIKFLSVGWGYKNTSFIIKLRIPIFIWLLSRVDFETLNIYTGAHVLYFYFGFRVRSYPQYKKSFESLTDKNIGWFMEYSLFQKFKTMCLSHFGIAFRPIKEVCSVMTQEHIEDIYGLTDLHLWRSL